MTPFRSVVAYVPPDAGTLGLGLVAEIFGDATQIGLPAFGLTLCAEAPGSIRTDLGLDLHVEYGIDRLAAADLVLLLPSNSFRDAPAPTVVDAVRAAYERGAIIASHGVGSFLLAATGLLDGRRATTHWRFAGEFAGRYPAITVVPRVPYVDEGQVITGAGSVAGIDLYVHLVRREYGPSVANALARERVPIPRHEYGDERLSEVIAWALSNLEQPLSVDGLAARALMSSRTFARRFKAATGATPHSWLRSQRLARVEDLLETTELPIEEIARHVGYSSATVLREQFLKRRGVPPRAYRQAFARHDQHDLRKMGTRGPSSMVHDECTF